MAEKLTNDQLVELIRKSGVVEGPRLDEFLGKIAGQGAQVDTPVKLAGRMIREGLLTKFQAEQFMLGRWKGFMLGKYKLLEKVGSGGMGIVYLAEHTQMRRRVALKILPADKSKDPQSLERFYREARAVAALDHPNIVRAHDVDNDDKTHFLVMEYVDGASLQDLVTKRGPLEVPRATHYIWQAALGLEHAHEGGLVHRDIKPANLLVHRSGVVKILDMGLARFFHDQTDNLSREYNENVLGTVDYLSPEQAIDSHSVDIRADIYSLGATFYFLVSGKTLFGDGSVAQKFLWHQMKEPAPIQSLCAAVPDELAAIIHKMLAKVPAERYQTPAELAEVLAPWVPQAPPLLSEEDIPRLSLAASSGQKTTTMIVPTPSTQVRAAASSLKGPAAANKPQADSTAVAASGNGPASRKITGDKGDKTDKTEADDQPSEKKGKKKSKAKADADAAARRRRNKRLIILGAIGAAILLPLVVMRVFRSSDAAKRADKAPINVAAAPAKDTPAPAKAPPKPPPPPDGCLASLPGHAGQVWNVAFAASGAQVLSGGDDNVRMWDLASGNVLQQFAGHVGRVDALAISRDGGYIVANSLPAKASKDPAQVILVWHQGNPAVVGRLLGHTDVVTCAAFAPQGRFLLTGSRDKSVRLWNVETSAEVRKFPGHKDQVGVVAYAPDGITILSASGGEWNDGKLVSPGEKIIRLWNADSGAELKKLVGHTQPIDCAVFSPDGKQVLSGGRDQTVRLWDVASGKLLRNLEGHTDRVVAVAFVPGAQQAMSCSFDQTIRLWDLKTFKEMRRVDGPASKHRTVAFSADGKRAVSASDDKTVRIWKTPVE